MIPVKTLFADELDAHNQAIKLSREQKIDYVVFWSAPFGKYKVVPGYLYKGPMKEATVFTHGFKV